jgi:hypothetical protein
MPAIGRALIAAAMLVPTGGMAEEKAPIGGQVFNYELNERIHYSCLPKSDNDIICSFTQATVSMILPEEKIAARRAENIKSIDTPGSVEQFVAGSCDAVKQLEENLAKGEVDELARMPEADKEKLLSTFRNVCKQQDRDSVVAFMELSIDIDSRTCMVSTFGWEGNFSRNDDKAWVRTDKDGPVGDGCGGVHLDRFELSESGTFWNLVRLAVASNPKGTFTTGELCSEVYSGKETVYEWQGGDLPARCDYIRLNLYN